MLLRPLEIHGLIARTKYPVRVMKKLFGRWALSVLPVLSILGGCADPLPPIEGCEPIGDIIPFCDMKTPEDIAALDDGRHLLLAHFGGMDGNLGGISLFDTQTSERRRLFPADHQQMASGESEAESWGEPECTVPGSDEFGPHGTHLHQLADGRWRYLVVSHGGVREAIDMFELLPAGSQSQLLWRGCMYPTEDALANDVVGLSNGDLVYSYMYRRSDAYGLYKSILGINTGALWRWNREQGAKMLPGTEAAQPNGLEISADDRYVFANMYMEKQVWKVDVDTGDIVARGEVAHADNSAWGADGRLWVATHNGGLLETGACFDDQSLPCPASFEIIALHPETMETESLFEHRGAPMGAATVAVPQAGRVYLGSFAGDRMISVPAF